MAITSVSIIGSGNLATHLAKALYRNNTSVVNIYSRNYNNAAALASQVGAVAVTEIQNLVKVDLIIISISDSAIQEFANKLNIHSFIVHTSGSTTINALANHKDFGVLYPFQTFSKEVDLDFFSVPIFIEANNNSNMLLLKNLAEKISGNVRILNSEQRLKLHLSAVFANNFSNHMYSIAREILQEANLPFDLLRHLIQETTNKALLTGDPVKMQTGPAIRHNTNIMEQHKEILAHKPLWQKIYTFVSSSIMDWEKN